MLIAIGDYITVADGGRAGKYRVGPGLLRRGGGFEGPVGSDYTFQVPMARSARVQQVLEETATFTSAERAELAEELAKPIVFTKADMDRQRKAIVEFLAIPTFSGNDPNASSDKYAFLKHNIEG